MGMLREIFNRSSRRNSTTRVANGIRVKPNQGKESELSISVDDELATELAGVDTDSSVRLEEINKFRELSSDRNAQYDAFDQMEKDASVSAALKMYADDATQYNLDGSVIWVESDDPNVAAFGNRLLDVLGINEKAWAHIYNLVKYGDIYLETFYDDEDDSDSLQSTKVGGNYGTSARTHKLGARIEEYIELVPNPATIFDLRRRGKTEGFIKLEDDDDNRKTSDTYRAFRMNLTGTEQHIMPSDKFIHIMLSEESNRYPETFVIEYDDKESNDTKIQKYTVAKGKSILNDVFKSFREVQLIEDSILLNRVTRSARTNILQVEVGDMPKNQVKEKLRQIKVMIEQHSYMDKEQGTFANQASPGPMDNIVYVPVRDGKGAISMTSLGGDVDPKSLADLEYYQQKEAGGLGVPLSYLNQQSGDGGGLSSGTALTKLDNKYARTVKRIQLAYISGITTLINIFALRKGLTDHINNFKVKMVSPSTIEDDDRDQQLDARIGMVDNMLRIIEDEQTYSNRTRRDTINYLVSTFLNKPEIAEILLKDKTVEELEQEAAEQLEREATDANGMDNDFGGGFSASKSDFENDFGIDEDTLPDIDDIPASVGEEGEGTEEVPEGDLSNGEFGDFEDFA